MSALAALLVLVVAACQEPGGAESSVHIEGELARFETAEMIVEIERGSITRIFNRLTGTDYLSSPPGGAPPDVSTGIVRAVPAVAETDETTGVVGPTVTKQGAEILRPELTGLEELEYEGCQGRGSYELECRFSHQSEDMELVVSYALDPDSGSLFVRHSARAGEKFLAAVRFGLSPVTINGDLLLPSLGGIKAAPDQYQFESRNWNWPTGWMLPLLIFDDPNGGFWIHSRDPEHRFKSVRFAPLAGASWGVAVETENTAPFATHDAIDSVTWRMGVYRGDWTVPVDAYKKWHEQTYEMVEKSKLRPEWVHDTRLVIKHADHIDDSHMLEYLDQLEALVVPSQTLLFNTNWIDGSKGAIMPYWSPSERGKRFNQEARARGFRTMFFANYIGVTPNHPRFDEFRPHVIRNAYSGNLEGWNLEGEWSAQTGIQLYYVNPALKAWREEQIGQFRQLFSEAPADGLFIDQTFLIFNDGNGLLNGESTLDGNLAFHEELVEALPGVALGGESVNEITMQFESFWEHHPLSLNFPTSESGEPLGWKIEPDAFRRMVPILPHFTSPHSYPIGYLGFPETSNPFYTGWRDALVVYGGVSTITRPTLEELRDEDGEVRRVIGALFSQR